MKSAWKGKIQLTYNRKLFYVHIQFASFWAHRDLSIFFLIDFWIDKLGRGYISNCKRIFLIFLFSPSLLSFPSGGQWAVIDTNYPRFALTTSAAALPTSTVQHSSSLHHSHHHHHHHHQQTADGQNSANDNLSLSSNHSSSHGSSSNSNSNNNTSIQSQTPTPVQLQYQTTYSPQIIAVNPNNIVNSYPPSISTPTSPIVQSVYSQQSTPIQSPVNTQNSNNESGASAANSATSAAATVTPAPPKRKRSVNPQGEENFLRALDAVRFGGIGFCKGKYKVTCFISCAHVKEFHCLFQLLDFMAWIIEHCG